MKKPNDHAEHINKTKTCLHRLDIISLHLSTCSDWEWFYFREHLMPTLVWSTKLSALPVLLVNTAPPRASMKPLALVLRASTVQVVKIRPHQRATTARSVTTVQRIVQCQYHVLTEHLWIIHKELNAIHAQLDGKFSLFFILKRSRDCLLYTKKDRNCDLFAVKITACTTFISRENVF